MKLDLENDIWELIAESLIGLSSSEVMIDHDDRTRLKLVEVAKHIADKLEDKKHKCTFDHLTIVPNLNQYFTKNIGGMVGESVSFEEPITAEFLQENFPQIAVDDAFTQQEGFNKEDIEE